MGVASSLYIYKELLMRCELDFMESETFPEKVHRFLYDAALFNPSSPVDERGKSFFVKNMGAKHSEQIDKLGITVVLMSLEIIQAMTQWYPKDFFTEEESRYVLYHEKLKKKGVSFPSPKDAAFISEDDHKKFKTNFKRFLKRME